MIDDDQGTMIVSREREKLINAIIYFVRSTKHCHTLKLFKLLNFLDFEHYRQTGQTVTGLTYAAFPHGPVPPSLFDEISRGGDKDLRDAIVIRPYRDQISNEVLRRDIKPKISFNKKLFSPREMKIMVRLGQIFYEVRGADMSEFSHINGLPWKAVYKDGEGRGRTIDPALALKSAPIDYETPTIDPEELKYRKELLKDLT